MHISVPNGPFDPTWDSLERYQVPEWYLDAKFGIFIHWGVYSVPAYGNEWYPRNMYRQGSDEFNHHIAKYGPQSKFGYKDFIPLFKAEHFNPADWTDLFYQAGARFVVPVAEHHDGFAMYDCDLSDWTSVKMGPERDIVGELAVAVRERGMTFGLSSHRAEHWWFMSGGKDFDSDVNDPQFASFYGPAAPDGTQPDEAYLNDWLARICELADKYRPQIVWFDWWIEQPAFQPYLRKFAAYYYNRAAKWGAGVAINYKNEAFPVKSAVYDVERGQLGDIRPQFWQTDTSISNNSWCYVERQDYKSAESIVHSLIDIVSKNGCLLLNIGPQADGTIPEPERDTLLEIGRWLQVNGEAIYGSRPWKVYGEGPTAVTEGSFSETKHQTFTSQDIRFTIREGNLYAILLKRPADGMALIRSLGSHLRLLNADVAEVKLLGSDIPLEWQRDEAGLRIQLPTSIPSRYASAVKITTKK
ncbi:MAG: alpha-L-fucosidase [Armatimonadetes bacterium]|nr:alpha-L-fucosidase [Armatimonadota bacterium]